MSYSPDFPSTPTPTPRRPALQSLGPNVNIMLIPTSPPRKAPSPPAYSPRRARDRHINMREPAKVGLFTVDEEQGLGSWKETFLALKTDLSLGMSGGRTPEHESDDPFGTPMSMGVDTDVDIEVRTPVEPPCTQVPTLASSTSMSMRARPARLTPLDLNIITSFPSSSPCTSALTPTPVGKGTSKRKGLMGAAPILSPEEYSATRDFDLGAVLEDLLSSCGEQFPMPPPRSPAPSTPSFGGETSFTTPPKPSSSGTRSPPGAPGPKRPKRPQLKGLGLGLALGGDHSFLTSLSRENSPISPRPSSAASTSSPKRLPPRGSLPSHWTDNVI